MVEKQTLASQLMTQAYTYPLPPPHFLGTSKNCTLHAAHNHVNVDEETKTKILIRQTLSTLAGNNEIGRDQASVDGQNDQKKKKTR